MDHDDEARGAAAKVVCCVEVAVQLEVRGTMLHVPVDLEIGGLLLDPCVVDWVESLETKSLLHRGAVGMLACLLQSEASHHLPMNYFLSGLENLAGDSGGRSLPVCSL